jgi:dienelactone hydrolase
MTAPLPRLRERSITFANGSIGHNIDIPSATPVNYFEAISRPTEMVRVTIDGKLFLPPGASASTPLPLVIVVPGSLGVAGSHLAHAQTLTGFGIAAFVLDPFGARGVGSTVANQTQYSFAASAYDVLAAWQVLSAKPQIDAARIGAQGHSRGGSAVLAAACRRFADAAIGPGNGLKAVLAAYPWSGHQFLDPAVGDTEIRVLMGDRDEWCSPMQVQGHEARHPCGSLAAPLIASTAARHSLGLRTPPSRLPPSPPTSPTTVPLFTPSRVRPTPVSRTAISWFMASSRATAGRARRSARAVRRQASSART